MIEKLDVWMSAVLGYEGSKRQKGWGSSKFMSEVRAECSNYHVVLVTLSMHWHMTHIGAILYYTLWKVAPVVWIMSCWFLPQSTASLLVAALRTLGRQVQHGIFLIFDRPTTRRIIYPFALFALNSDLNIKESFPPFLECCSVPPNTGGASCIQSAEYHGILMALRLTGRQPYRAN